MRSANHLAVISD